MVWRMGGKKGDLTCEGVTDTAMMVIIDINEGPQTRIYIQCEKRAPKMSGGLKKDTGLQFHLY